MPSTDSWAQFFHSRTRQGVMECQCFLLISKSVSQSVKGEATPKNQPKSQLYGAKKGGRGLYQQWGRA